MFILIVSCLIAFFIKYFCIFQQVLPFANIFSTYLQIVLENSGGALKLKVVEYGADKTFEGIYMPSVVSVLESEPLISVSIR